MIIITEQAIREKQLKCMGHGNHAMDFGVVLIKKNTNVVFCLHGNRCHGKI